MNIVLALTYSLLTLIGLTIFRKYARSNPVYWFLVFQWLMGVGIMLLIDVSLFSDLVFVVAYFMSSIAFLAGALVYVSFNPVRNDYFSFFNRSVELDDTANVNMVWFVLLLSILVTVSYYIAVGSNIFLNIVLGLTVEDFSSERLAAYSGDTYFAPGYANQFKNILLPLCTSILGALYFYRKEKIKLQFIIVFSLLFLPLALLGTGQRAFLAYSFAAFVFAVASLANLNIRRLLLPALITFVLFTVMTFLYKSNQITNDENFFLSSILKTFERFFYTEQEEVIVTFRVIYERNIVWLYEWYEQLRGILPGIEGSYLQHDLFAHRHGNDRGTAAVSTVASVVYNGGLVFVSIYYFILGFSYFALYHRYLKGRRSVIRVFSYCALFFYLSIFVSGGPSSLINNGAVAIILFILLRKLRAGFSRIIRV